MSKRGLFIVIEGINGAGKSTLAEHLAARLPGYACVLKFPSNKTAAGRQVIEMINLGVHQTEKELFQQLMVQDRLECAREVEHMLRQGVNVIADRYTMSGVAYGTADGLDYEGLLDMNSLCLKPDFCVLLHVPAQDASRRQVGAHRVYVRNDVRQRCAAGIFHDMWMTPAVKRRLGHDKTGWAVVNGGSTVMGVIDQALSTLSAWGLYQKKEEPVSEETKQVSPFVSVWQSVATGLSRELAQTRTLLAKLVLEALNTRREMKPYPHGSTALHEAELYLKSRQTDTEGQQAELIGMLAQQNENLLTELRNLGVDVPHR